MNKNRTDLRKLRMKIDFIDKVLLSTLKKRMILVKKIGNYKHNHNLQSLDRKRWNEVIKTRVITGRSMGLSPSFIREIFTVIHTNSLCIQKKRQNYETIQNRNPST